ncbi:MAG: hypothetical protein J3Q66DRAFT_375643 [Benniella sp.]|nr:MAG: hypothetical protein J3Q66DRAFT_375643 [Benniella sp.]
MLQRHLPFGQTAVLLVHIISILFSTSPDTSAHAQSFKPRLTSQPGNAFVDGKALYILNGRYSDGFAAQQAFKVDLSVSWNTNSPAYKVLPQGPGANWFPTAMSADGQKWFALVNGVGHVFDIRTNQWNQVFTNAGTKGISGHAAATDPVSGKIYIPFAYRMPDGTFNMLVVDLEDESQTSDTSNFTLAEQASYAVTWNAQLRSLLFLNENGIRSIRCCTTAKANYPLGWLCVVLLAVHTISILFSLLPDLSVHAQSFKPRLTSQPGSAFVDGKALYILNGRYTDGLAAQQAFMIDLSVPWNTDNVAYKVLSQGPGANWFPTSMTADGQTWFALVNGVGHVYDVQSNHWSQVLTNAGAETISGHAAATDPVTGKIYIPFAYRMPDGTFNMLVVDLKDGSQTSDNNNFAPPEQASYAVTWNAHLKSLLFLNENGMYMYSLSGGWRNISGPPDLTATSGYCMVSSSSGSKLALFGGHSKSTNTLLSDIYVLDVPTLTWKKGSPAPLRDARRYSACALSNGHFIAWGGDMSNATTTESNGNMLLVYNLETDTWMSDYSAPPPTPTDTNRPGNGGETSLTCPDNAAAKKKRIIFVAVVSIVLMLLSCCYVCFCRK